MNPQEKSLKDIAKITAVVLAGVCLVVALAVTLVVAKDFILLIFLGVLFGVFLTHCAGLISGNTPLGHGWSLAIVVILLLAVLGGGVTAMGYKFESQLEGISSKLDNASEKLESWLDNHPLAMQLFKKVPFAQEILSEQNSDHEIRFASGWLADQRPTSGSSATNQNSSSDSGSGNDSSSGNDSKNSQNGGESGSDQNSEQDSNDKSGEGKSGEGKSTSESVSTSAVKSVAGKTFAAFQKMFATTLGLVANLGLIFFSGLFLAVNPSLYRDGFAKLFPKRHRERVSDVMDKMAKSMFAWLNGRFIAMLITGAGTGAALFFLGVPMAITIGIITALLTFIPNIGGIIALSLAMLMAFTQGPMTVVWVIVIYAALQLVESNIITPLIQQHQTSIPPALLLGFQVILGALTGFMGLLVATPLLAAGLVAVREFWIKDVLDDQTDL